jgi:hypothetical protein
VYFPLYREIRESSEVKGVRPESDP